MSENGTSSPGDTDYVLVNPGPDEPAGSDAPPASHAESALEDSLLAHRDIDYDGEEFEGKYTSSTQMLFLLLRANVGASCLSLPWAFAKAGTLMSPLIGLVVGLIVYYNVLVLIRASETLQEQGIKSDTYASVALAAWSSPGELTVKVCLILLQLGVCVVAFSFAAESLSAVLPWDDKRLLLTLVLMPVLALSFIRDLRHLSPFAVAGTCCIFLSILVVIGVSSQHLATKPPSHELPLAAWNTVPIFFGSAVYAWECIGVVMAFRKSMGPKNQHEFLPIFNIMMFISGITFLAVGEIAYVAYGHIESPSVLVFLADTVRGWMFPLINLLLAFATIFGVPLQLNPAAAIFRDKLQLVNARDEWKMTALRAGLVFGCYFSAMLVPNFALVVSLVGSSVGTVLAMVFPVLLDLQIRRLEDRKARCAQWFLALVSSVCGLIGTVMGTRAIVEQVAEIFWQAQTNRA